MKRVITWRALFTLAVALPLVMRGQAGPVPVNAASGGSTSIGSHVRSGGLSAAEIQRLSLNATRRVIVILRNQHQELAARGATRANRLTTLAAEQAPVLSELAQVGAPRVRPFHVINAVAATVSAAEAAHLQSNPNVLAVIPDRTVRGPQPLHAQELAPSPIVTGTTPCTAITPSLEPEALQLTQTAFKSPLIPQAQNIVTGRGVTVAFIADGLDINNPDFIRPDGSHVFVDYEDFSGDGPNAVTGGAEAFGDASSIAAQGTHTYDINQFVNPAHQGPGPCPITIRGMAPGVSLIGLKAFGNSNIASNSSIVQAIEYAVDHGADVLNESFGGNPFPDTGLDPVSLADDAAVAAGVTVVTSTGDAGTAGTVGTPATNSNTIAVGASTQFRAYAQTVAAGIQLGNGGWVDDNISSLSSGGISQLGKKAVDVVAPGDLGWALCTPNTAIYTECTDYSLSNPSPIQVFGGTSESSPLVAGEAALVIQAYRQAHGGASPAPALVKQIIKSTAVDLTIPSYEQGAGLINSYRAVQLALSYNAPIHHGNTLLVTTDRLTATDQPNTTETFPLQVTNEGTQGQFVSPSVQTLGAPLSSASYVLTLDPATDPAFVDDVGRKRAYTEQDFTVAPGAQRLDAAISWNVTPSTGQPAALVRLVLFDPQGRFAAYSIPQDAGGPFPDSGYGHVDVRFPAAGTWRAVVWTRASSIGYRGPVHLDVSTSRFVVAGAVRPATRFLLPGQTGTFMVAMQTPAQPGDESANVVISSIDTHGVRSGAGDIPVTLRSLVPLGPSGASFGGTLTGGNGRFGSPGQTLTYQFDVPAGQRDLDLGLTLADSNYNLEGVLVDPNGLPIDVQSTATALDPNTGIPNAYTNALQFFRRDPQAGRWTFVLLINDNTSGQQTAIPFTARLSLNGVSVQASGLPNDAGVTLTQGVPATATISVANTGLTTKDVFADPRLAQVAPLSLGGYMAPVPFPVTLLPPSPFYVPTESSHLAIAAESMSPTVPINLEISNSDGAPPFGGTGWPDINATSFLDPFPANYEAIASTSAPEVPAGLWGASVVEVGPFPNGATPSTAQVGASVLTQQFDPAVVPSTGDAEAIVTGQSATPYAPLTLAPGGSGAITLQITPTAAPGTVVHGFVYIDTLAIDPNTGAFITGIGDELIAIPYTYTVGSASAATK